MPLPTLTLEQWYAADIELRTRDAEYRSSDLVLRTEDLSFRRDQAAAYQAVNAASTAAQTARAVAEQAVASMGSKQADAALAAATLLSRPAPAPTDAELLLRFFEAHTGNGMGTTAAQAAAKASLAAYKALIYKPPAAPL